VYTVAQVEKRAGDEGNQEKLQVNKSIYNGRFML
jgi:hypothetical protein